MPCEVTKDKDGTVTKIVCSRGGSRENPCEFCGVKTRTQCDFPVRRSGQWQTCDKWVCSRHSKHIDANTDYCQQHRDAEAPKL
jgi:hypothetical protein